MGSITKAGGPVGSAVIRITVTRGPVCVGRSALSAFTTTGTPRASRGATVRPKRTAKTSISPNEVMEGPSAFPAYVAAETRGLMRVTVAVTTTSSVVGTGTAGCKDVSGPTTTAFRAVVGVCRRTTTDSCSVTVLTNVRYMVI